MPNITTPVGRLVAGSLYKANDKDFQGNPLVVKTGPNAGQPRIEYFFAVAIAKQGEQHWAETAWGQEIWATGHAAFPHGEAQRPDFAWKITDGDSQVPNRRGARPCDKEGYPGHWVLSFSSGYAPRIYNADGTQQIVEEGAVKCGYFIQVAGSVEGNNNSGNPGVYLNHSMVALAAYGEEIHQGPDPSQAGFGGQPLPPGASATPPAGGQFNPAPAAPAPAPAAGAPGYPAGYTPPQPPAGAVPPGGPTPPPAAPPAQPAPAAQYAPSAGAAPAAPSAAGVPGPNVPGGYYQG